MKPSASSASHRGLARACLLTTVACLLVGCTTWRAQSASPSALVVEHNPDRIRVSTTDGSQMILDAPSLQSDSVVGQLPDGRVRAVALAEISQVEVRERDGAATAQAIVLVAVLVFVASKACFGLISPCGGGG